jgi:hypothetical protein
MAVHNQDARGESNWKNIGKYPYEGRYAGSVRIGLGYHNCRSFDAFGCWAIKLINSPV